MHGKHSLCSSYGQNLLFSTDLLHILPKNILHSVSTQGQDRSRGDYQNIKYGQDNLKFPTHLHTLPQYLPSPHFRQELPVSSNPFNLIFNLKQLNNSTIICTIMLRNMYYSPLPLLLSDQQMK